jgi:membrane protein implicated in regulation of membrane protease activity
MSLVAVWVVVALGAGILEVAVPAFGFVFVTLAALVAAVLALLGLDLAVQVVVFAGATLFFLLVLRRFFVHRLRGGPGVPSRTEALQGKLAEVTEPIDPVRGSGRVLVEGHDWAARSPVAVPSGVRVRIDGADGIVLLVSPIQGGAP